MGCLIGIAAFFAGVITSGLVGYGEATCADVSGGTALRDSKRAHLDDR